MLKSRLLFNDFVMEEWKPNIEIIEGDVHKNFLREAYAYAWKNSIDCSTKTGALIVNASLDKIILWSKPLPRGSQPY